MAYTQVQKITSPSPSQAGNFGSSVAIDGFYAVIGEESPGDTHLYKRNVAGVWELQAVFPISGKSVAIYKTHVVIGNGIDNVKVYDRETHTELQNFEGDDGFGNSVAINNDYIVIGSPYANSNRGAIYIYKRTASNSWTAYSANPVVEDIQTPNDYFGYSVTLNGTSVLAGAYGNNQKTGAIYAFDENDNTELWEQSQKIIASDGAYNDEFGKAISASNNYLVSGARLRESSLGVANAGAAYLYKYETVWYELDKLEGVEETSYEGNHFGESVHINGDYIIVGSPKARNKGVADIFYKKRSWGHLKKIVGSDTATDDDFGQTVAISGRFALIGSIAEDTGGDNAGAVYFNEDPPVRIRLAQQFDVYGEYLPSKATAYLKRYGKNSSNYWEISNSTPTVIDASNFSTITKTDNVMIFSDEVTGFTGNGYVELQDDSEILFPVINYPVRAITPDTFDLWIRCISSKGSTFNAEILIDGNISKTIATDITDPSAMEWAWVNTTLVLPDTREHILGIRIKDSGTAIDKLYIEADSSTPYSEGPDYITSPYLTIHMQVYDTDSNNSPDHLLYMYDYKNSITEVIQNDWYNFDIKVLDINHGYTKKKHFSEAYFLVMSCSGSHPDNFVIWEMVDNDEYQTSPSAVKF